MRRALPHVVALFLAFASAFSLACAAEKHPTIAAGEKVEGKVVGVTDGDTLTLLVDKTQYKIRLAGIDAPESGQPFGTQAKKALSDKVFGKTVTVLSQGADKYGRTLGVVHLDGCVNTAMVCLASIESGKSWISD